MSQKEKLNDMLDGVTQVLKAKAEKKPKEDDLQQRPMLRNADDTVNETAVEYILSEIENLKDCIMKTEEAKPKQGGDSSKKRIQLYVPEQTAVTNMIVKEVPKWVKDITCTVFNENEKSNLREDVPVFVLCQVVSRPKSDISAALSGFKWSKKYVVLVVFVKREEYLPKIQTGDKFDTDELLPYGDVEFIDIAFTKEELIYQSKMNKEAPHKIKKFVDGFDNH